MENSQSNENSVASMDVARIRDDFPILTQRVNDKPLVYLDNAATTQKPQQVIDAITQYYQEYNANVHRAVHTLGEKATVAYEKARSSVQRYINARSDRECIFVRGTTEGINMIANSFVEPRLEWGDEIIVSEMAHHSNIVPWQLIARRKGANLRVIPINNHGELDLEALKKLLASDKAHFLAIGHVSNAFGTINPLKEIIAMAHDANVTVLVDGAQAGPHVDIDVQDLDCDFYAFSSHKMYGPTGIGAVYGKQALLEEMSAYQGGGEMITFVSFDQTDFQDPPYKFEAGTPNISGAIGFAAAIDYVEGVGKHNIAAHEAALLAYATDALHSVPGAAIVGTAKEKVGILSFNIQGVHHQDIGTLLNSMGIAVRCGHHCAMPAMSHFDLAGSARASFAMYNTTDEIDAMVKHLHDIKKIFSE